MPSIRERAIEDCKRYLQSSFDLELKLTTPDASQTVTVYGKGQDTNITFKTDGQDQIGQRVHITFAEADVLENNPLYPIRDSNDLVNVVLHLVEFKDARGVLKTWQISQQYPDNMVGTISGDCSEYGTE
jgi:hypothetical protein